MSCSIRDKFFATYLRQRFSLPESTIYYILKNPKSSKIYQKLIQTCKYFFAKNPILVYHCLQIDDDGSWNICSDVSETFVEIKVNIKTLSGCKLWIQNGLFVYSTDSDYASDLTPHIYQFDAEKLLLREQILSLQQFLFYSKNAKRVGLERSIIYNDDDSEVPIEEIIVNLPEIDKFVLEFHPLSTKKGSSDTVKKLLQIPHFKNIDYFVLMNASEKFDIDAYYKYFKNSNTKLTFDFRFQHLLSEDYAEKLEGILSEILLSGNDDRLTSLIFFDGQEESKIDTLCDMFDKYLTLYPLNI